MNNKELYFKKLEEIVKSSYIKNEDYETVIEEIAGNYEKALAGNLLFVSFDYRNHSVSEVLTNDKVIINIPIRPVNLQQRFDLREKWLDILKGVFNFEVTKLPIITPISNGFISNGLISNDLYAVTFDCDKWYDFFCGRLADITDKITKDFRYDKHVAEALKNELTDKAMSTLMVTNEEMVELITLLSENFEEIASRGLLFYYSFSRKKTCFMLRDDDGPVIMDIPDNRFKSYVNTVKETLKFQASYENESLFYPSNFLMAEVIKGVKQ